MKRWVLIAGLACGLAGCYGSRVTLADIEGIYSISEVGYGAGLNGGVLPVIVNGDVFPGDHAGFAAAVAALMPNAIGAVVAFKPLPAGAPRPDYYVVWNFGPGSNTTKSEVCGATSGAAASPPLTAPRPVTVYAGFCRLGSPLSTAYGTVEATATDQPGFQELVTQITLTLFPTITNLGVAAVVR